MQSSDGRRDFSGHEDQRICASLKKGVSSSKSNGISMTQPVSGLKLERNSNSTLLVLCMCSDSRLTLQGPRGWRFHPQDLSLSGRNLGKGERDGESCENSTAEARVACIEHSQLVVRCSSKIRASPALRSPGTLDIVAIYG